MEPRCRECGEPARRMLYMGVPGWLCLNHTQDGAVVGGAGGFVASVMPVTTSDANGISQFAFVVYDDSYWSALWRWLKGV